jgi:3',5'-cyclic AMP phosphodiesterase CpdA
MRIAHLADLHIGRRTEETRLRALADDLRSARLDLLALSGDLTDFGLVSEFRRAKTYLDSLEIPYVTVPGNREVSPLAFWEWVFPRWAMSRYTRFFGAQDRVCVALETHKVALFGLNSVHPFPSWPGKISRESRYWLREQARARADYFKVLFLHHPVIPVMRSNSFWAHILSDAGDVLDVCTQTGVSLILQGHKHRSSIVEMVFPQRKARLVISSSGAPLVGGGDPVYHIISIHCGELAIEPRRFEGDGFVPGDTACFS